MPARTRETQRPPFGLVALMFAGAAGLNLAAGAMVHAVVESGFEGDMPYIKSLTQIALIDERDVDEDEDEDEANDEDQRELEEAKRLAELDRVTDETKPDEAELMSEFDNRSDKDTRRPLQGQASQAAQTQAAAASSSGSANPATPSSPTQASPSSTPAQPGQATAPGQSDEGRNAEGASSEGVVPMPSPGATPGTPVTPTSPSSVNPAGGEGQPLAPSIQGSTATMAELFGVRPGHDPTREKDIGAENDFDTERNRYASFYNRVRQGVVQHWHPDQVMLRLDPQQDKYPRMVRTTRLLVRLHPDGELDRVRIMQSAGVEELDDEAVKAVRAATPFMNPPKGLIDEKSGRIRIDLGFTLHPNGAFTLIRSE